MTDPINRCRLVLVTPDISDATELAAVTRDALRGGDVASVIVPQHGLDEKSFQKRCEALVPVIQAAGAAALIAGDSRVAGRVRPDGLHLEVGPTAMAEAVARHAPGLIVGGGNARERHAALSIGEAQPDYVMFGSIAGDIKPEPHSKNLALAEWWADMIEIPCVIMGGTSTAFVEDMAQTRAEFIAFGKAVFADPTEAPRIVAEINATLDEKAPRFGR
ncbi:thiamine-phosphate pyrophosphorylase [Hoeflea sp. BAL378]|uniref:thiamine phosphate synthase n=1 Tax=Hoeflea sp. BAL378 TaxID=1547437 RepID=UPI00051343BB|nr:thiamine phosphate synthase [Hoeflea sp. BAL378]KGF67659.1 thiamine-phosphate pyrophosphorylase [Hoeflea sp. BAL378]